MASVLMASSIASVVALSGWVGIVDIILSMTNLPPLTTETLWAILNGDLPDDTVNQLVWHTLGYRSGESAGGESAGWHSEKVDEKWREKYPEPPNFIESRPATVQLTRAIPSENKQLLKTLLGFKGYSVDQLIPRLTRRATMANWLLSEMRIRGLI
jgi:hypothetical protein